LLSLITTSFHKGGAVLYLYAGDKEGSREGVVLGTGKFTYNSIF